MRFAPGLVKNTLGPSGIRTRDLPITSRIYIYIYIMKEPNFCTIKAQELVSQELQPLIED